MKLLRSTASSELLAETIFAVLCTSVLFVNCVTKMIMGVKYRKGNSDAMTNDMTLKSNRRSMPFSRVPIESCDHSNPSIFRSHLDKLGMNWLVYLFVNTRSSNFELRKSSGDTWHAHERKVEAID